MRADDCNAGQSVISLRFHQWQLSAYKRMHDGTYGECVHFGDQISIERLEILLDPLLCKIVYDIGLANFGSYPINCRIA